MHHPTGPRTVPLAAVLVAAVVALLLSSIPVHAASSVQVDARPLLGGRYEVGGWAAIAVTLVNEGQPTEGHLSAETRSGVMRRHVEMPAGARKVVTLYVQPDAFQRRITIRYEEPNGTVESVVEVRVLEQVSGHLAIVGDGGGTLRPQVLGNGDDGRPEPFSLAVADLPERPEPLAGLSGIVWAADSTGLTDAQRRSLERWIADGGQLVVVAGGDWQARTDRFAELLPLEALQARDEVPQATLATWAGTEEPPVVTATVAAGTPSEEARVLVEADDGTPLVSLRPIGAGRVVLLGSDFATDAHRGWVGAQAFWSRLVPTTAAFDQFWGGGFPVREEAENAMSQALGNVPSLAVPPAELLLAVIVGYILLIGPISYVVLRRMDRRELAWVTAPLLVVLFTACSYGIGSTLKGGEVIVNQISLIRSSGTTDTALVQAYAGIFSPSRDTFDLTVEADALMGQLRPSNVPNGRQAGAAVIAEQGEPARLRGLSIGVFGFEGVRADAIVPHSAALSVSWSTEDGRIVGTVTNVSDTPLLDVAYIGPSTGDRIGDLEPGASASFNLPRRNVNGTSASDQVYGFAGFNGGNEQERRIQLRRQVIDSLVGYGGFFPGAEGGGAGNRGPFVIGWREDAGPLAIEVDETTAQRLNHSVEVVGVRPVVISGEVTVEPGRMSVVARDLEGDAHHAGPGMISLADGSVTFSIALPLDASGLAATDVEVIIGPDPGTILDPGGFGGGFWPAGYVAEIRDARSGEWSWLGDLALASRFTIDDPSSAMSAGGRIEVRVSAENGNPNFGPSTVAASARVSGVIDE